MQEAIVAASRAIVLAPPHKRRRDSYTRALVDVGEIDHAIAMYREWLAEEPDNAYVRHHLAACLGEGAPERASDAYVEQVFDSFASSFDAKLASLGYRAPELVAGALAARLPTPARQFDIADLGCGTGLCGPLLAPWARRLTGCDLVGGDARPSPSGAPSTTSSRRPSWCSSCAPAPAAFDVVVSADTLCYFGALDGVVEAARSALRAGGQIVFTVEAEREEDESREPASGCSFNGRYVHARAYLRSRSRRARASTSFASTPRCFARKAASRCRAGWSRRAGRPGPVDRPWPTPSHPAVAARDLEAGRDRSGPAALHQLVLVEVGVGDLGHLRALPMSASAPPARRACRPRP